MGQFSISNLKLKIGDGQNWKTGRRVREKTGIANLVGPLNH
jgi:hypothetical protein